MWPLFQFFPGLLTYSEDFGSAACANALSSRTFVLHCDSLRILDLNLFFALHAICLHFYPLVCKILNRHYHREHGQSIGFVDISSNCHLVTRALLNHSLSPLPNEHFAAKIVLSEERESM